MKEIGNEDILQQQIETKKRQWRIDQNIFLKEIVRFNCGNCISACLREENVYQQILFHLVQIMNANRKYNRAIYLLSVTLHLTGLFAKGGAVACRHCQWSWRKGGKAAGMTTSLHCTLLCHSLTSNMFAYFFRKSIIASWKLEADV